MIQPSLYSEEFEKWTSRTVRSRRKKQSLGDTLRSHARFSGLYFRSRLGGYALGGLTSTAFLGWCVGWQLARPSYEIPDKVIAELLTIVALFVPLVAASAIGLSVRTPFGEEETVASRSLSTARLCHLGGLLAYGIFLLFLTSLSWDLTLAQWILVRNLAGLAGLTFLTARMLGGSLSWVLPFAYSALALTVNLLNDDPPEGWWTVWAWWFLQPATNFSAATLAFALLVLGTISVCWARPRL